MSSIDSIIGDFESLNIIVYEHVSSGGFSGEPLPEGILSEGFAMLRTAISDFQAAGHHTTVLLDSRLSAFDPPLGSDNIITCSSLNETMEKLYKISDDADAALVIAPESNQILQSLVQYVEKSSLKSLNCIASGIKKAGDKSEVYSYLKRLGIHVPETIIFKDFGCVEKITEDIQKKMQFPVVFKPLDGASCAGISLIREPNQITLAIDKIKKCSTRTFNSFIVQPFIEGVAASVSLISTGRDALPISLNKQNVNLSGPESNSSYNGGVVPLEGDFVDTAFTTAKLVVESFDDLRGYVGVDLILNADKVFVVDVNPRLTTSYVGLHNVGCFNTAEAILNAVLKGELPTKVKISGYSCFSKIAVTKPVVSALPEIYKMNGVVSPPFPFSEADEACAFVEAHGATFQNALNEFREAKENLQNMCHGGM